jgi:hypothetical protein
MKKSTLLLLFSFVLIPVITHAQGGIGNMPRADIVMLRQTVRDSLSDEVFAKILQLKAYAEAGQIDSAAAIIAYNGSPDKTGKWGRAVNLQNADEKTRVESILAKIKQLFADYPEQVREYYAVFKDKDNPAGQRHVYQIHFNKGKTQRMVNWTFFPIGDVLMLGEFS